MHNFEALLWILGILGVIASAFLPFFWEKTTLSDDASTSADPNRDIWPHSF